jgi:2-succinyl-5-enolpyruvyl-6-hydroxy-3-cyclohexene-1-carboxylate synthase
MRFTTQRETRICVTPAIAFGRTVLLPSRDRCVSASRHDRGPILGNGPEAIFLLFGRFLMSNGLVSVGTTARDPIPFPVAEIPSATEMESLPPPRAVRGDAELNFRWAAALIDSLVAAGVVHAVMSPGAQMVPLSLACRANPRLKVSVVIDERSAAFYALGLARVTQRPTVLICTSGSATAQYFPAVMEAATGLVPLIVLTADRAPENQDRCSAQAVDQIRVFGLHVRASHSLHLPDDSIAALPVLASRAYEQALWPMPGPVHINVPFREPLVPKSRIKASLPLPPATAIPLIQPHLNDIADIAAAVSGRPGVIVCGTTEIDTRAGFRDAVLTLARQLRCPVIADPLSNLRFGLASGDDPVIARGDAILRSKTFAEAHRPDWVMCFGGPATATPVLAWLKESKARDYIVVDHTPRWPDPLQRVTRLVRSSPAAFCRCLASVARLQPAPAGWLAGFQAAERRIDAIAPGPDDDILWEAPIVRTLLDRAPEDSVLFSGNSMSVRDFDTFSGKTGKALRLMANRGTNGIDGAIATFLGVAAAQRRTTYGLIGDMTFSHDVGSLQLAGTLNAVLVVLNNGGGAIFEYLPTAGTPEQQDFLSPPRLDIALAARAGGWTHWRADSPAAFAQSLAEADAARGPRLIEAVIDRSASVARHKAFWDAAQASTRVRLVEIDPQ